MRKQSRPYSRKGSASTDTSKVQQDLDKAEIGEIGIEDRDCFKPKVSAV